MRRGLPIVLSAASGTGKTTLSRMLLDVEKELTLSISYTTRAPRGREQNGVEYHFVDDKTFLDMIAHDAFIEHALVHGNRYGSSREWTREQLDAGHDVLFDIDVQGGAQLKRIFPEAVLIFLMPPSMEELERRLRGRGTDADEVIARRLDAARREIEAGQSYDHRVINQSLENALSDLREIIARSRVRFGTGVATG